MISVDTANTAKNEMKTLVLTDLAALCKKLADNPAITEEMRETTRRFVEKYNSLGPFRGKSNPALHFQREELIDQIARFLPNVLEIKSFPEGAPDEEALV